MVLFTLKKKDLCLCGSGKKYKHCCFNYIEFTIEDYRTAIDKCNYKLAYNIINSELTKYLINVKRHTVPMLKENNKIILPLLKIDIEAVGEYLSYILFLIKKPNFNINFITKVYFIASMVDNNAWIERINSFVLVFYYIIDYDEKNLLRVIEKINIDEIADIELIKIILDIKDNDLGIGQKLSLIEKIIESEKDKIIKLKYQFHKSLLYFFNNDKETAQKIIKQVSASLNNFDITSKTYYMIISAQIYSFIAQINSDTIYFDKAIKLYLKIIDNDNYTDIGKANNAIDLGYLYYMKNDYENAIKYLEDSKNYTYLHLADIYLAFVKLNMEDYESAEKILSKIDYNELSKENSFDYLVAFSLYILKSKDISKIDMIYSYLKNINLNNYHCFDTLKMELIVQLRELPFKDSVSDEKIRIKWLDIINKTMLLQPNICGLGINFNNIIDKFNKK